MAVTGARPSTVVAAVLAMALGLLLLAPGLGRAPLDDPGEGQHAEIAREVLEDGHWLTLRLNGVRYFDKPPLLYWLTAGAFSALGVRESAARLAPLAGALLAAAATAVLGARLLGPPWGFGAAAALLSSVLFAVFGRYVRPETLFVASVQWGLTGLVLGLAPDPRARPRRGWLLVGCAALGLASLAKDPLGLVGPLAAIGCALALAGRLRWAVSAMPWAAIALLLAIGFGWYAAAALLSPGFAWYTVVDNHVLNLLQLRVFPDEDVPLSSPEFLAVSALGAFPWSLVAVAQIVRLARRRAWRDPDEWPWVALSLWVVGLVALFAVAPFKLPHYALPAYPAVALLAARRWRDSGPAARRLVAVHLIGFAALGAAALAVAHGDGARFTSAVFSTTDVYTRKEAAADQPSPLPPWPELAALVTRLGAVLGAGAAVLAAAWWLRAGRLGFAAVAATMLAVTPLALAGTELVASGRAVAGLARDVGRRMEPGDVLVHEGPIENSGALELYSGRRPALLDARRSVLGIGATYADARGAFWDASDLDRAWRSGRRVFLVTPRAPGRGVVATLPADTVHLLAAANGRWLYANDPAALAAARPVAVPSPPALR